MKQRLGLYIVAGGVGFITDFVFYLLLLFIVGLPIYLSRFIAFLLAIQITYFINSRLTFTDRKGSRNRYFIGQTGCVGLNYLSFILLYEYITPGHSYIAFIGGSVVALLFNFILANFWAFKTTKVSEFKEQ